MGIIWGIGMTITVFCNYVLFTMVDKFREINNGFEVHANERLEANIYRIAIIIVVSIGIFFSSTWWISLIGYILGYIASVIYTESSIYENSYPWIIFWGKFLKPIGLLLSLIGIFVL